MSGIVARERLATPRLLNPEVREAISNDTSLIGNFGLRPVPTVGEFVVPFAVGVLVLDAIRGSGDLLFGRSDLGRAQRVLVVGECLRECRADLVGPAPIMLDDLVGQLRHEVLRWKKLRLLNAV